MKTKTPKRLKGFEDFFAEDMKIREFVINTFKKTFEKYGYEPLETPALEYSELILGQSGQEAEKQYYRFKDRGGRDVMLKYEVMISMCRAVAQNINNLPMPYKRYQIQRVWRAENVQKGRYREFTQCDADTIGTNSILADAEFIQMGLEAIKKLGFQNYIARISNKKFLEGIAEFLGIEKSKRYGFQISIDKLEKIGQQKVIEKLIKKRKIKKEKAEKALELINSNQIKTKSFQDTIIFFKEKIKTSSLINEALDELQIILNYLKNANVDENLYKFDPSIARGLASYTGPVWEFSVLQGGVGSIAGCGRYDKAIEKYIGKKIPATGGSFGIERICDIIKNQKIMDFDKTFTDIMVTIFDKDLEKQSIQLANKLRKNGISVMLYPEAIKLSKQFKYADKKNIPFVAVIGPDEIKTEKIVIKNMLKRKEQESLNFNQLVQKLKKFKNNKI